MWTDSGRDSCQLQTLGSPLSRSTYSLIESGKGNLLVNNLVGLQIVFAVTYEEFFKDIWSSYINHDNYRNVLSTLQHAIQTIEIMIEINAK